MTDRAAGSESAWDGEEDYFLVGPVFAGGVVLGDSAGGETRGFGCVWDVGEDDIGGEGVACFEWWHGKGVVEARRTCGGFRAGILILASIGVGR